MRSNFNVAARYLRAEAAATVVAWSHISVEVCAASCAHHRVGHHNGMSATPDGSRASSQLTLMRSSRTHSRLAAGC